MDGQERAKRSAVQREDGWRSRGTTNAAIRVRGCAARALFHRQSYGTAACPSDAPVRQQQHSRHSVWSAPLLLLLSSSSAGDGRLLMSACRSPPRDSLRLSSPHRRLLFACVRASGIAADLHCCIIVHSSDLCDSQQNDHSSGQPRRTTHSTGREGKRLGAAADGPSLLPPPSLPSL